MDGRLDTADMLYSGILDLPVPKTDIPEDRDRFEGAGDDCCFVGVAAVVAALEDDKVVTAPNYYGIPYAWKQADGVYRGTLLQYRRVTEAHTFATVTEVAEWFESRYHATDG